MKIMVVDDHILFREGLVYMLNAEPNIKVVGEAGSVNDALTKARETKPDLILMDYSLPDGNGPDAARLILTELPRTNIVFLTVHEGDSYLLAAIRAGAMGYLVKDLSFTSLVESIRAIANHEPVLSPKNTLTLMHALAQTRSSEEGDHHADLADFTTREIEILRYLAVDASNQEIADRLTISVATVKNYIHNIFHKFNFKNRKEVASFARRQGLGIRN
jgi:DNA-binding NarL/FixJ family response regulator